MNRREFLKGLGVGVAGAAGAGVLPFLRTPSHAASAKPNFVFILIDDMGWRDLACYGSTICESPNVDRLAAQGVRFTDGYAACPVCSPTRASILTGRYPARLHLTDWIAGHERPFARLAIPDWTKCLPLDEVTIPEALKPAGYVAASIGKWHLGGPAYRPEAQGFDLNVGGDHRGQPPSYFVPYRIPGIPDGPAGEYLTDRLTDEALRFIEANRERPFFLYLTHYAVHMPIQARRELIERHRARGRPERGQNNATYAAMIQSVDESVGRVVAKLAELGIADRTVVFFMSDNGGLASVTSNAPLRAGKGTLYEGGIREPWIVKWPGVVQAGSTCSVPVSSIDFFPTILEMAGVRPDPQRAIDGLSTVPLLRQTGGLNRDALYWHYPHYHLTTPAGAVRCGDHKLIEYYEDGKLELYDLKSDLGERTDLAARMPERAAELRRKLDDWRRAVGAQMPTPNPRYDPTRDRPLGVPPKAAPKA